MSRALWATCYAFHKNHRALDLRTNSQQLAFKLLPKVPTKGSASQTILVPDTPVIPVQHSFEGDSAGGRRGECLFIMDLADASLLGHMAHTEHMQTHTCTPTEHVFNKQNAHTFTQRTSLLSHCGHCHLYTSTIWQISLEDTPKVPEGQQHFIVLIPAWEIDDTWGHNSWVKQKSQGNESPPVWRAPEIHPYISLDKKGPLGSSGKIRSLWLGRWGFQRKCPIDLP